MVSGGPAACIHGMTADTPPHVVLRRLIDGYAISQALYVAATLGVADCLAEKPRSIDDLSLSLEVHTESLYRIMRALASVGVFHELDGRWFALTPVGECLRADAIEPVGGYAAYIGRDQQWRAWGGLLDAIRTGENAFRHVHGSSTWEYRAQHPAEGAIFDRAMTDLTRRVNRTIVESYDFGRFGQIVDVGGGRGALLAAILLRHPVATGVLFDLPTVVAQSERVLVPIAERCEVRGGDFFVDALPTGADAYVLKTVLHDWDDRDARRILGACRAAATSGARLLIIEWDLGRRNGARDAKVSDLNMLVGTGGRVRSADQHAELLDHAGFRFERAVPTAIGYSVIEAVAS
jgi:O-methyltransferase domain/Dimerisation domain